MYVCICSINNSAIIQDLVLIEGLAGYPNI